MKNKNTKFSKQNNRKRNVNNKYKNKKNLTTNNKSYQKNKNYQNYNKNNNKKIKNNNSISNLEKENKENNIKIVNNISNIEKRKNKFKIFRISSLIKALISMIFLIIFIQLAYAYYNSAINGNDSSLIAGNIYMNYLSGREKNINIIPSDTYRDDDYYEFQILGKNTSNKDIMYDITINHGASLPSPKIRLNDSYLRFRLVTVEGNTETEIFSNDSYDEIDDTIIHIDKIEKNTNSVNITYRLYVWVTGVIVGNTENANYTSEEWSNIYTNINLSVTGDFSSRVVGDKITVTFDPDGGVTPISTKNVIPGGTYGNLPTPTKSGYAFIGWSMLPKEYQAVEYIESTGTQYINTGLKATETTGFEIDFNTSDFFGTPGYGIIIGTVDENVGNSDAYGLNTLQLGTWHSTSGGFMNGTGTLIFGKQIYYYRANNGVINAGLSKNVRQHISFKNGVYTDPSGNTSTITTEAFESRDNMMVFARIMDSTVQDYAHVKLYSLKFYDGNTLTRYYVPCYKKSNNDIGLYDIVNDVFYTNQGSGNFSKGSDVEFNEYVVSSTQVTKTVNHTLYAKYGEIDIITFDANGGTVNPSSKMVTHNSTYGDLPIPTKSGYTFLGWNKNDVDYILPAEYQELDYIESDGAQYINTGFTPNQDTRIVADFEYTKNNIGYYFTGSEDLSNNTKEFRFGTSNSNNKRWWMIAYGNSGLVKPSESDMNRHLLDFNKNVVYLDNNLYYTFTYKTFTSYGNAYIFRINNSSEGYGWQRLYSYKLYDNGVLIRDYIPCYRKIGGAIGLYDVVNGKFYANDGTGAFTAGNEVNSVVTSTTQVTANIDHTLYAVWGENHTVTFNANGGTVNISNKTISHGSSYGELPIPTKSGYTFLGWSKNNLEYILSDDYQEVEYLKFAGAQRIDTGVIPSNHTTEIMFDFGTFGNNETLFGTSSGNNYYSFKSTSTNRYTWGRNGNVTNTANNKWSGGNHVLVYNGNNNSVVLDNEQLGSGTNISSTTNLILGAMGSSNYLNGKIYYVKITDKSTGNLVKYLIPCYRKSDNVIGMCNMLDGVFFTNQTSTPLSYDVEKDTYVLSSSRVMINGDHTLYAIWEEE